MALNRLVIPVEVMKLEDLNIREKLLLGMVLSFKDNGLFMSNGALAELLGVCPLRVSHLLKKLKSKGYITIKNGQSKYRRIYYNENANVHCSLPISFDKCEEDQPISLEQHTLMQTSTINKKNINNKKYNNTSQITFSFETKTFESVTPQLLQRWIAVYPAVDIQGEILRAAEWLLANPQRKKENYSRFLTNWFARCQEKKGESRYGITNRFTAANNRKPAEVARPGEFIR
jgi:biotin operon repressor